MLRHSAGRLAPLALGSPSNSSRRSGALPGWRSGDRSRRRSPRSRCGPREGRECTSPYVSPQCRRGARVFWQIGKEGRYARCVKDHGQGRYEKIAISIRMRRRFLEHLVCPQDRTPLELVAWDVLSAPLSAEHAEKARSLGIDPSSMSEDVMTGLLLNRA